VLVGWHLKKPPKVPNGNLEFAPSVAEADAILAKFGYAERNELAAA
jgi:hypothetical protein